MMVPALEFRDVTLQYPNASSNALTNVSLVVRTGERVALLGLNGSGKTSLLLSAVGLTPARGSIVVDGATLSKKTLHQIRDRIGFVFGVPEDQLLLPTVLEDVAFGLDRGGHDKCATTERAQAALERVGLAGFEAHALQSLSHGEKQRVAIAGAVVAQPPLLLLDEPSAGLDPPGKRALARMLAELGAAMLVATHDLDLATRLCSRFIVLAKGRVAYDGSDLDVATKPWQED